MNILEFQYFQGCPNSSKTLNNLKQLINDGSIEVDLKITEITDLQSSEKENFPGSPTILINRIDIYTKEIPQKSSFTCRIYDMDGVKTGILSKDFIKQRILELGDY